jgi:sugar lactone lactonase YvrE
VTRYLPDPPVYAPNGGTFRDGLIIFGASGSNATTPGATQYVSIRTVDPATNKSTVLLNNYFGSYFNNIDDLAVHPISREIFFTDPYYSYYNGLTDYAQPQLPAASYRFNPDTGAVVLIDDTLKEPNGIAFSPDGSTLYISDTGGVEGSRAPGAVGGKTTFNATGPRTIYAFDVANNGTLIFNKRSFYLAQDWVPDGLKVAANEVVLTGAGIGVDVIAPTGELILRIQTNYTVQNFAWVGRNLTELWIMGNYGVSRVRWGLVGQELT